MLAIQLAESIILPIACLITGGLAGYILRSSQIKFLRNNIARLEKDMLLAHAEILEIQKENVALQRQLKESSPIPVIPIKAASEEKNTQKSADKHS